MELWIILCSKRRISRSVPERIYHQNKNLLSFYLIAFARNDGNVWLLSTTCGFNILIVTNCLIMSNKRRAQVIIVFINISFEDLIDYITHIRRFRHRSVNLLNFKSGKLAQSDLLWRDLNIAFSSDKHCASHYLTIWWFVRFSNYYAASSGREIKIQWE